MPLSFATSNSNCAASPSDAQEALDKLYADLDLHPDQTEARIVAVRDHFQLGHMVVAAGGGIHNNQEVLSALEFFVIQTNGHLNEEESLEQA